MMNENEKEKLKQEIIMEINQESKNKKFKILRIGIIIIIIIIIIVVALSWFVKTQIENSSESNNVAEEIKQENTIELTTENWKDYLEIKIESEEVKNEWGELKYLDDYIIIKLKEPYYSKGKLNDIVIELSYTDYTYSKEGTTIKYTFNNNKFNGNMAKVSEVVTGFDGIKDLDKLTTDDFECTRIKGTLSY